LRRAFAPDDFDADAMINSSKRVRYNGAQDSRAMSSPMMRRKIAPRYRSVVRGPQRIERQTRSRVAESLSRCGLQARSCLQFCSLPRRSTGVFHYSPDRPGRAWRPAGLARCSLTPNLERRPFRSKPGVSASRVRQLECVDNQ
jgi:hypothetical protein